MTGIWHRPVALSSRSNEQEIQQIDDTASTDCFGWEFVKKYQTDNTGTEARCLTLDKSRNSRKCYRVTLVSHCTVRVFQPSAALPQRLAVVSIEHDFDRPFAPVPDDRTRSWPKETRHQRRPPPRHRPDRLRWPMHRLPGHASPVGFTAGRWRELSQRSPRNNVGDREVFSCAARVADAASPGDASPPVRSGTARRHRPPLATSGAQTNGSPTSCRATPPAGKHPART